MSTMTRAISQHSYFFDDRLLSVSIRQSDSRFVPFKFAARVNQRAAVVLNP